MMSKLKALIALALGVGSIAYNLIFFCTSFGSSLKFQAMAVGGRTTLELKWLRMTYSYIIRKITKTAYQSFMCLRVRSKSN